ncbi:MAG: SPFH domain-containing protein [Candidatus Campbellbacteria bacterium]|nr:SPFH domain-containing protein [Candidatus Campbellbacteria bacterium]
MMAILLGMFAMGGCGERVEVPPAHVGKLSTESGLQEKIIQPSKFRLEGFCWNCDSLILVEASDHAVLEQMVIFMPKDQLNLNVDVRGVFAISSDKENVEKVFSRVTADQQPSNRVRLISMAKVYNTYGQPVVREAVRSILAEHSIAQVMENRSEISAMLVKDIRERLKSTPITTIRFGLADIQPPQIVVTAQENRKEREIGIQKAEAEKQIALKQADAALEVAKKQQEVDLKEAETQALVNRVLADSVSEPFVTQRWLKIMETLAKNPDGRVFVMPFEGFKNPAVLMGTLNNAMAESNQEK